MTPEEARALLDGTTPGPWEPHPDYPTMLVNLDQKMAVAAIPGKPEDSTPEDEANLPLLAAAPDMARTIAGMTTEHRHEVQSIADGTWHPLTEWAKGEPDRRPWNVTPTRIVRRYVTEPEVTDAVD